MCFQVQALSQSSKFEAEIREEKEERKKQEVEKKERQAAFKQLQSAFYSWPLRLDLKQIHVEI